MGSKERSEVSLFLGHRRGMFSAVVAVFFLITIALVLVLNACSSSSSQPSSPGMTYTTPTVVPGSEIGCSGDFFSDTTTPAKCFTATLAGCPNTSQLGFTYSYDAPASPKGTILFLGGGSGTSDAGDVGAASDYFASGFEVIQVEWSYDWEVTNAPGQGTSYPANVQLAACRQAAFLNYVFNMSNTNLYSAGGRCVEASSAGSGAVAYALSFYGAGNYLDAVELKSGPPIADFEQGCEVPTAPDVTICGTQNGGPQFGCQLGGSAPWTLSPQYTGAASGVRIWTNDNSCAAGATTSASSNAAWLAQSIVNGGTPPGVYSYPHTAMTAWLCQSVDQSAGACVGGNSHGQGGNPQNSCPNNSTSQAEIYYSKLTSDPNNLPQAPYKIYAVQNCDGPEGVSGTIATVPALGTDGSTAIETDMLAQCHKH